MARRWLKIGTGAGIGITTIVGLFYFFTIQYGFIITDLSGDFVCEGTFENPCISEFEVKNPNSYVVDIYSKDQVKLDFSPEIYDYALFVPDGRCSATGECACILKDGRKLGFEDWRCVDFTNKTKSQDKLVYNFRFNRYSTTTFRLAGIKLNPEDTIKWSFNSGNGTLDPKWLGTQKRPEMFTQTGEDEINVIIEFKDEPLLPFKQKLSETKKLNAKQLTSNQKIKIENTHKNLITNLEKSTDYQINIKREYKDIMNGLAITIKRKDLETIKNMPNVKNVWEDQVAHIYLQDSVPLINANDVWAEQNSSGSDITGEGITVAIIDTGIAYNHTDFEIGCDNTTFIEGNCNKTVYGWDFVNDDNDPYDDYGHGTHCAGIVGANGNIKGVAPNVTFLAYKVCNSAGSCLQSDIISAIENATLYGANVISMSLGVYPGYVDSAYQTPILNAVNNGTIMVVAAGNDGPSNYTIGSPGADPNVITVGASNKSDSIASFSSRGFTLYSNYTIAGIKPDVLAPGVLINSTMYQGAYICGISGVTCDGDYALVSGTSMATPHIAGVVALLKQAHTDWTVTQIKSAIANPSIDLGYNPIEQGSGRVDALKSYNTSGVFVPSNAFLGHISYTTIENFTTEFNLTDLVSRNIDYNFSLDFTYSGITANLTTFNISLLQDQSDIFNLTLYVDFDTADPFYAYFGKILINSSENQNYSIPFSIALAVDTYYPTFANYTDNNASLFGKGIGIFNSTLLNTNTSVFFNFDGTNYSAISSNWIDVNGNNLLYVILSDFYYYGNDKLISVWFRSYDTTFPKSILLHANQFRIDLIDEKTIQFDIQNYTRNETHKNLTASFSSNLNDGGWHHIVTNWDNTLGNMSIWIDSELINSSVLGSFEVGNFVLSTLLGGNGLNGSIDEFRYYYKLSSSSGLLNDNQISQIVNSERIKDSTLPTSYLRMWFPMDEGYGSVAYDKVGPFDGSLYYGASWGNIQEYFISLLLQGSGTFPYYWWAYGNGQQHLYNESQTFYYTINETCTQPNGNWIMQCSDYCNITSDLNISGNFTLDGSGKVTLNATIDFNSSSQYMLINPGCEFEIKSGGQII